MNVIYLACPYTSTDEVLRDERKHLADKYAARIVVHGAVFSPITHGTRLEGYLPLAQAKSHAFWMEQCIPLLRVSSALFVLPLDGWRVSKGVQMEIELAKQMQLPIYILQERSASKLERVPPGECDDKGWVRMLLASTGGRA